MSIFSKTNDDNRWNEGGRNKVNTGQWIGMLTEEEGDAKRYDWIG